MFYLKVERKEKNHLILLQKTREEQDGSTSFYFQKTRKDQRRKNFTLKKTREVLILPQKKRKDERRISFTLKRSEKF